MAKGERGGDDWLTVRKHVRIHLFWGYKNITMATLAILLPLLLLSLTQVTGSEPTGQKLNGRGSRPNIVVLLVDDLGIGDIGCYGNTTLETPHIDSLARDGVKMTQFLTAAAVCTPSRAAFLTGRYPIRSGMGGKKKSVVTAFTPSAAGLPPAEVTFPELLKEAGYTNALIGKWHLGLHRDWVGDNYHNPLKQGFDYWFGIPLTNLKDFDDEEKPVLELTLPNLRFYTNLTTLAGLLAMAFLWQKSILGFKLCLLLAVLMIFLPRIPIIIGTNMKLWNSMLYRNYDLVEQPIRFEQMTQRLVAEGVEFLEARQENREPFQLYMSFLQVHTVLHAGPDFQGTSKHGAYGDEVKEMDWGVGQILKTLDRLGLRDDTLVLFTSDHGGHVEELGKRGDRQGGHNGIYRGGKFQGGMDGGIRVPAIIRWPGHVMPGTLIDVPVSNMDFLPTVAEVAGVLPPRDRVVDGVSLIPLLTRETTEVYRDYLIHYCSEHIHAIRFKPDKDGAVWKVRYATPKWFPGTEGCGFSCFCDDSHSTFHDTPLVFDMTSDPRESKPLPADNVQAKRIVKDADDAIRHHRESLEKVELQLTFKGAFLRPWLLPCCNFPLCDCKDTKQYKHNL